MDGKSSARALGVISAGLGVSGLVWPRTAAKVFVSDGVLARAHLGQGILRLLFLRDLVLGLALLLANDRHRLRLALQLRALFDLFDGSMYGRAAVREGDSFALVRTFLGVAATAVPSFLASRRV